MYTLKDLQDKNLKELKEIGWQLNVLPEGDRRVRQNWINALIGTQPPLLQLLEVSPGVKVEQAQEPIETPPGVEFNADEFRETHAAEIENYFDSFTEGERPPGRGEGKGDRLEVEPELSQSAIGSCASPVTFSSKFLATYPPYFGEVHYKAEASGQLNLLEPETDDEPPDPDDFKSLDAFNEALARWDAENAEALAGSMDSLCEWAPCPHEWYEPEPEKLPVKASSMRELSPPAESSSTFSIPIFDAWCDRQNRQNDSDEPPNPEDFDSMFAFWAAYDAWLGKDDDSDEPPDTGNYAKLPGPKPPKFPPRASQPQVNQTSRNYPETIPKLFHSTATGSSQPARSPPGGDAM